MHLSTIRIYFEILICIKYLPNTLQYFHYIFFVYVTIPLVYSYMLLYSLSCNLSIPHLLVLSLYYFFNAILAPHYFIKKSFLMPWHICKDQTSHAHSMNSTNLIDHLIIYVSNWYHMTLLIMYRTYICQSQKTVSNLEVYTRILILFNFVIWIWNLLAKSHLHIFLCTLSILS